MRTSVHVGRRLAAGYLIATALGATALALLPTSTSGPFAPMDAVFTAASAVTLTGLTVLDPMSVSGVGYAVIAALIAFGTVGVAVSTVGLLVFLRRGGWTARQSVAADVSVIGATQRPFLAYILICVALAVVVGGAALWASGLPPLDATFHALSGFANAGFSTLPDSLATLSSPAIVIICVLVVVGGCGYPVTFELARRARHRSDRSPMSLTTVYTLSVTAVLLLVGAVFYSIVESTPASPLASVSMSRRATAILSLTVMPRSAGFSLFEPSELSESSQLLTIVLMFLGGGPAATAGGIKTTGVAILAVATLAAWRGHTSSQTRRTAVAPSVVAHAVAVAVTLAGTIAASAVILATSTDPMSALFNATSATTTTGLSLGSPTSSNLDKATLTLAMLIGRLAPMLFAVSLMYSRPAPTTPAHRPVLVT